VGWPRGRDFGTGNWGQKGAKGDFKVPSVGLNLIPTNPGAFSKSNAINNLDTGKKGEFSENPGKTPKLFGARVVGFLITPWRFNIHRKFFVEVWENFPRNCVDYRGIFYRRKRTFFL